MATRKTTSKTVTGAMRKNKKGHLKLIKQHVKTYNICSFKKRK